MKKKIDLKCPECGSKLKIIAYGKPLDVNNKDYYFVGTIINPKLKYYCENCDKAFLEDDIKK